MDGLLFVTPEYNRSIPGILNNAIDYASRPYGDNAWTGKPAGMIGVSIGAIGTAMARQPGVGVCTASFGIASPTTTALQYACTPRVDRGQVNGIA